MHVIEPESGQSAVAAHDVFGAAFVRCAQQNCPAAHTGQMPGTPAPLLLLPAPLLLLLLPPPGAVGLFDPHPPETAAATAVANTTPSDAKNTTCAFLMSGPYPL